MVISTIPTRTQIYHVVDHLRPDQLARLWEYMEQLVQEPVAPLYTIHENAIPTGIKDMADQHDHYLYGTEKHDA